MQKSSIVHVQFGSKYASDIYPLIQSNVNLKKTLYPFKRQPHKMVKGQIVLVCLTISWGWHLKGYSSIISLNQYMLVSNSLQHKDVVENQGDI